MRSSPWRRMLQSLRGERGTSRDERATRRARSACSSNWKAVTGHMTTLKSYFYYFSRPLGLLMLAALAASVMAAVVLTSPAWAASFAVTKTADTNDGACNSDCSLREAIVAANAAAGADTITVPNGTYTLTLSGKNEDAAATGDLDIAGSLTLNGASAGSTIIDGNNTDAVFDTFTAPSGTTINMSDLTIRSGNTTGASFDGAGGIYVKNTVTMDLKNVNVLNNTANTSGGGIWNEGRLTITNGTISGNQANALGGGIRNAGTPAAALSIANSTISNNVAEKGGGIHDSTDGGINLTITGSTISGNQAVDRPGGVANDFGDGAGIHADTDGGVSVTRSTLSGNTAARNGGAIYFNDSATQAAVGTLSASFNRIRGNTATS